MKNFRFILIFLLVPVFVNGQTDPSRKGPDTIPGRVYLLQKVKRNGVTLPEAEIKEVVIVAGRQQPDEGSTRRYQALFRKYERTVNNVKRVYPYARIVRERLASVNADLENISNERDRREYMKQVESDVFRDYQDDMEHLTITQGKILIKLIDRETQNTSYSLIKQYRGTITAAFWQGVARIFGTNLKEEFDPYGNDILIELIVQEIEAGRL